jgi:hydrogenase maturation protease
VVEPAPGGVLVIGLGSELRGDDGAGIAAARRLRDAARQAGVEVRELAGDPLALLDAWSSRDAVVIVDAMRSGVAPGTVRRIDASASPPAAIGSVASTHAVGLCDAIELARALDRLPARVIVHAVEGASFEPGRGLSPAVAAALPALVRGVLEEARGLRRPETR